jgi:YD repeat-containing protein
VAEQAKQGTNPRDTINDALGKYNANQQLLAQQNPGYQPHTATWNGQGSILVDGHPIRAEAQHDINTIIASGNTGAPVPPVSGDFITEIHNGDGVTNGIENFAATHGHPDLSGHDSKIVYDLLTRKFTDPNEIIGNVNARQVNGTIVINPGLAHLSPAAQRYMLEVLNDPNKAAKYGLAA